MLCRGSEATRETYRNPKKPCSLCVFIGNSAMGSPSTMLEFVESTGGSRLGRVDSSREVMEIPCWGVEIFRLEQCTAQAK